MTGPKGGKTTVTGGGLRRVSYSLDAETIRRMAREVAAGRRRSQSEVIRHLVKRHLQLLSPDEEVVT